MLLLLTIKISTKLNFCAVHWVQLKVKELTAYTATDFRLCLPTSSFEPRIFVSEHHILQKRKFKNVSLIVELLPSTGKTATDGKNKLLFFFWSCVSEVGVSNRQKLKSVSFIPDSNSTAMQLRAENCRYLPWALELYFFMSKLKMNANTCFKEMIPRQTKHQASKVYISKQWPPS